MADQTVQVSCFMQTRQMHGVEVEGAIVILDEAHNIVRSLVT